MKSAGKARNNGLYRHIRTSKEIIRNLLNDYKNKNNTNNFQNDTFFHAIVLLYQIPISLSLRVQVLHPTPQAPDARRVYSSGISIQRL